MRLLWATACLLLATQGAQPAGPSANSDAPAPEVRGPLPMPEGLRRRATEVWTARRQVIQSARQLANEAGPVVKTITRRDGNLLRVINGHVVFTLDEADGYWDAVWRGKPDIAVRRVGFSAEVDGKPFQPAGAGVTTEPFADQLGTGLEVRQAWGEQVRLERAIRLYDQSPVITVSGRITNGQDRDITLGCSRLLDISAARQGWWHLGDLLESPAAVRVAGISDFVCEPADGTPSGPTDRSYNSVGILALAGGKPKTGLVCGYLTAAEARPDLTAQYRLAEGGTTLAATMEFYGRKLAPGQRLSLDTVYLAAHDDPYAGLERYGDAAAAFAPHPVRKGPTSLWCSWYAHRLAMTEDLVLANAAVAARHFQPLGMEIIQLDHGWQRGDITGDWMVNERFPHGLKWLADELRSKYGFRLGVWIAPTDVAQTSDLYQQHTDWMLKDDHGKPRVNWRWYWKPNPDCYELDASNPAVAKWIEETFARLTACGVSYYKIDFIAGAAGAHFRQHDPYCTRGWSVLREAMQAVRTGAGPEACIRYCQPPPLLAAGLADGAYGGADTLDAGLGGNIEVLRTNARSLAASYWLNDRLYHREMCDMSVRAQADVEEVRMRLALMTLAGCSISFSDEFQYLPPSRIRMMQQCLPPGGPPMRPLDLFERTIPSIWHVHCKNAADEWDVVGLFNFERQPRDLTVDFGALGLPADADVLVFEFWEQRSLGQHRDSITLTLPPQTSRVLGLRRHTGRPQILGTDVHLLQGHHEISQLNWDDKALTLSGRYRRAAGLRGVVLFHVPETYRPRFDFPLAETSARLTHVQPNVWMQEIDFVDTESAWSIPFERAAPATQPPGL